MTEATFTDVKTIRKQAREKIGNGAVTSDYRADREVVLRMLNEALATELICVLRYRRHHFMTSGMFSGSVAQEFMDHSNDELEHADALAERITELGGEPDYSPLTLNSRSHSDYVACETVPDMIKENLVAERIAIQSYREFIRYLGDDDPTTRRLIERILEKEEEHADEMADFMEAFLPEGQSS